MAKGRGWVGAVQCLRPLPQTPRSSAPDQPEDRRDQESQSSQIDTTRAKEKGELKIERVILAYHF